MLLTVLDIACRNINGKQNANVKLKSFTLYVNVIPLLQIGHPLEAGSGKFSFVSSDAFIA